MLSETDFELKFISVRLHHWSQEPDPYDRATLTIVPKNVALSLSVPLVLRASTGQDGYCWTNDGKLVTIKEYMIRLCYTHFSNTCVLSLLHPVRTLYERSSDLLEVRHLATRLPNGWPPTGVWGRWRLISPATDQGRTVTYFGSGFSWLDSRQQTESIGHPFWL